MRTFSADEVFRIAQDIELKGQAYYTKAAKVFRKPVQRQMFETLAEMEHKHLEDFTQMRDQYSEQSEMPVDVDDQSSSYLQAVADGIIFDPNEDPTDYISEDSNLIEILKKAIDLEKNSIIFYIGLKDSVPNKSGKEKVESIIQQELSHIAILSEEISRLKTS